MKAYLIAILFDAYHVQAAAGHELPAFVIFSSTDFVRSVEAETQTPKRGLTEMETEWCHTPNKTTPKWNSSKFRKPQFASRELRWEPGRWVAGCGAEATRRTPFAPFTQRSTAEST